jgi:large repetitive protein
MATVSPQYSGTPTGSVTFYNGAMTLKKVTLSNGLASYTTNTLTVGTQSITAVYDGSTSFATSTSNAVSQVVNQASTTLTLTSSPNPSNAGQVVTFTAGVSGQYGGIPRGDVTFSSNGGIRCVYTIDNGHPVVCQFPLSAGTYVIMATYNGEPYYGGSSGQLTQTVNSP